MPFLLVASIAFTRWKIVTKLFFHAFKQNFKNIDPLFLLLKDFYRNDTGSGMSKMLFKNDGCSCRRKDDTHFVYSILI